MNQLTELQVQHNADVIAKRTPIEVLLQVGGDGKVSARDTYEFLEMDPGSFNRWVKANITGNQFAEAEEDFSEVCISAEVRMPQGHIGKRTLKDYRLSVPFAKKLCMLSKTERGEQARDYFIKVEDTLKTVAQKLPQLSTNELVLKMAEANVQLEKELSEVKQVTAAQAEEIQDVRGDVKQIQKRLDLSPTFKLPETTEAFDGLFLAPVTKYTTTAIGKAFGISARALNRFLYSQGIQRPHKNGWALTGKYDKCNYVYQTIGYFKQKDGTKRETLITYWTATGKDFVCAVLKNAGLKQKCGVLPYDRHASRTQRNYEARQMLMENIDKGVES